MATKKHTTSRQKLTKTAIKRSAPIASEPDRQIGGEDGWFIVPASSSMGLMLLDQRKRASNAFKHLDANGSEIRAMRADSAADAFADALSHLPPKGAIEALAAALLIKDDVDMVWAGATEQVRRTALDTALRRVAGLAEWIESTHKIDRRDFGFGGCEDLANLIPHAARSLNVLSEHDR